MYSAMYWYIQYVPRTNPCSRELEHKVWLANLFNLVLPPIWYKWLKICRMKLITCHDKCWSTSSYKKNYIRHVFVCIHTTLQLWAKTYPKFLPKENQVPPSSTIVPNRKAKICHVPLPRNLLFPRMHTSWCTSTLAVGGGERGVPYRCMEKLEYHISRSIDMVSLQRKFV